MIKALDIFSPVSHSKESSGIQIRIENLKKLFEGIGFTVNIYDSIGDVKNNKKGKKGDKDKKYKLILISTKKDSISYKIAKSDNQNLILDLYTPIFLEKDAYLSRWKPQDILTKQKIKKIVREIIGSSKYFIVANKRQREYWQKTSEKIGSPIPKNKIFVLPTGAPKHDKFKKLKNPNVILWFGGIYPWLDPTPLLDALGKLKSTDITWKFRIIGGFHPKTGYKKRFDKIVSLAKSKIGERQLEIISWQSGKDLPLYLKDVALAVHLPKKTMEDYYAHRVRLLTLLNSAIPVLTSGKDLISKLLVEMESGAFTGSSSNELEVKLKNILSKPQILSKWGKNAHKVQREYNKQNEIAKFKKTLGI